MKPTKEQQATLDEIDALLKTRAAQSAAAPPPSGGAEVNALKVTEINAETVTQIVELARKDARQSYNAEAAKLDFAGGAAWAIACFGIVMIALVAWLGFKRILHPSKLIALGLIVTAALLLIVLGYTDEQMSPVIGLLGTIAGYMLGSKEWDGNDASATSAADGEKARKSEAEKATAERAAAKREPADPSDNPEEAEAPDTGAVP